MSILVAIIGSDCSIIATDSRRIESDGDYRDDYPKTFRTRVKSVIGGSTGLLEFSGKTIASWINGIPDESFRSMDLLVGAIQILFEDELSRIDDQEVSFENRRLDIVLLGNETVDSNRTSSLPIRSIGFFPNGEIRRVEAKVQEFSPYCTTGDGNSVEKVTSRLRISRPQALPRKRLESLAKSLILIGIKHAGASKTNPSIVTCGGAPHLTLL